MSRLSLVGLSGNITSPSKTRALVRTALDLATARIEADPLLLDLADFGDDLGRARRLADLSADAQEKVAALLGADALIVASPIYKASYTGLFKHLIDLIDPAALKRKPVLIATTGGGEKHALAVEHQLRPLFAFFEARVLSTGVHVSDKDFTDGILTGEATLARLASAVDELADIFPTHRHALRAAE